MVDPVFVTNMLNRYPLIKKAVTLFFLSLFVFYAFFKNLTPYPVDFTSFTDMLIGSFIGIFTFYLSVAISRFLKKILKTKKNTKIKSIIKESLTSDSYVLSVIFTITYIVLFSFMEEIVFRSIVLYFLIQKFDTVLAILFSSALFSITHFNSKYVQLFVMGVLFSVLVIYTDNLLSAIAAHISNNLMVFFVHNAVIREIRRKN